jgi:hypothetical protein
MSEHSVMPCPENRQQMVCKQSPDRLGRGSEPGDDIDLPGAGPEHADDARHDGARPAWPVCEDERTSVGQYEIARGCALHPPIGQLRTHERIPRPQVVRQVRKGLGKRESELAVFTRARQKQGHAA